MNLQDEIDRGIFMPVQIYPMFETALRAAAGRTIDEHRDHLGRLWADLSDGRRRQPVRLDPRCEDPRRDHDGDETTG